MGGLVVRYFLEVLGGWRDCRALVTFGTPYRGSLNALNFLANGYKRLFTDLSEVMRSFPSMYQLLPIYRALRIGEDYVRVAEAASVPGIDRARAEDALGFTGRSRPRSVIAVAVRLPGDGPDGRATVKRTFKTFYGVLGEAARWLVSLGVTTWRWRPPGSTRCRSITR
jgi:hypothetical protein